MQQIAANLAQNNIHLLAHSSIGQKSGQAEQGSLLRVSQGQKQSVRPDPFLEALRKKSASNFIRVVGRI